MIVRNEAATIRDVLLAAKPFIDRWTIVDTGSTDGTVAAVQEILSDIPGCLSRSPFVDFASNRNEALLIDRNSVAGSALPAHFQLMLSGDEYLRDGAALRAQLEGSIASDVDLFRVRLDIDDNTFFTPRIFRTGSEWKYHGKVDEIPVHPVKDAPVASLVVGSILHVVSDRAKRFEDIWENQIPTLEAQIEDDPDNARALTSLADKYETFLGLLLPGERITYAMRAMSLYMRRFLLPIESDVEKNYYRMRFLTVARFTELFSPEEMLSRCKELLESDPDRPETALLLVHAASRCLPVTDVYTLAAHAASVAQRATDIVNDSPISVSIQWKAHLIAASCAKQLALKHPAHVLDNGLSYSDLARQHVTAGIAAGGAWGVFQDVCPKAEDTPSVELERPLPPTTP
jgi:hypothetical protein